jgi:hypothetical protein
MDAWVGRVLGIQPGTANAGAGSISIMRLGKARIEWIAVRRNAQAGIGRLRDAIADEFADDEEQAVQLANALSDLGERIDWLDATLEQQLDAVLTADAAKRPPLISTARATLDRFTSLLAGDPILKAIDGNDVLPEVVVVAPLQAALSNIASALG